MAVTYNLKGTTNPSFKIGKSGSGTVLAEALQATSGSQLLLSGTSLTWTGDIVTNSIVSTNFYINDTADIFLDAAGGDVILKKGGGIQHGYLSNDNDNFVIKASVADKDLIFRGSDSGSEITALTLDMSDAGAATFGGNVTVSGNLTVSGTTTTVNSTTIAVTNSFTFEGATADDFETVLTVTDPTADRTITLPDATGTVALTSDITFTDLVNDTSPQLGGDLESNGNSIKLPDSATVFLGASDDMQILHDGSSSVIKDVQGNQIYIQSTNFNVSNSSGLKHIYANNDYGVTLYYQDAAKLETTSSGVQTTGTVNVNGAYTLPTSDGTASQFLQTNGSGSLSFATVPTSVVEDTTPQLGGTLDANGNTIDMGTNVLTDTNLGQFATAYSWGDHSTQNYLSGTLGFPTDLGAVTGSTTSYLGLGPDLGSIATGDTFVGLVKDFGIIDSHISLTTLKTVVSASTDFADFKTRIAGL